MLYRLLMEIYRNAVAVSKSQEVDIADHINDIFNEGLNNGEETRKENEANEESAVDKCF